MFKRIITSLIFFTIFQQTAFAQIVLNSELSHKSFETAPGQKIESSLEIRNAFPFEQYVELAVVDGSKTQTGSFSAKLANDKQNFIGAWSSLEQKLIKLQPNQAASIPLTIEIPTNATPGDYSGGITATKISEEEAEFRIGNLNASQAGAGVKSRARIATPFYISIPGERIKNIEIGEALVTKVPGQDHQLKISIKNTGNTTVKLYLNTTLQPFFGETIQIKEKEIVLLGKEETNFQMGLGELPILGFYTVNLDINYTVLDLLNNTEEPFGQVTKTAQIIIIPWNYVIATLIVLLAIISFFVIKKHNLKSLIKRSSQYTVKESDSLADLAQNAGIKWKQLAKINNIKPPYEIKPGQKILLPKKK